MAGPNPCSYAIGWTAPTYFVTTWPPIKECVNKDQIDKISAQHWLLVSKVAGAPFDNRVPQSRLSQLLHTFHTENLHLSAPLSPHCEGRCSLPPSHLAGTASWLGRLTIGSSRTLRPIRTRGCARLAPSCSLPAARGLASPFPSPAAISCPPFLSRRYTSNQANT